MDYDLLVIGGGINGVGVARDAAGRGLSVMLVEAQDLAGATSSASTKLIHGGLRYLEQYDFKLVKESLHERERLYNAAPHIISPMRFVLPHDNNLRPFWMIRAGLFLYDFLAGKKSLPKAEALDFATDTKADPLENDYKQGFSYSDCWVDDARLVTLNAVDAYERGAVIMPRTACNYLEPINENKNNAGWRATLENMFTGDQLQVTAKVVVNAAGPWVRQLLDTSEISDDQTPRLRLVKGSHLVVPKLYEGDQAYILQQPDGRIIFTIPYEEQYSLVGTTDVPYDYDAGQVAIDDEEIEYLCDAVNRSFKKSIKASDVIWSYSGVRSLLDDGKDNISKVTRDYKIHYKTKNGSPVFSIFGGKLTTYRALADEVVDRVSTLFPDKKLMSWTAKSTLPGGDIPNHDFDAFYEQQKARYTFMPEELLHRYARAYGTRIDSIMEGIHKVEDLGAHYGDSVYEAEIQHMIKYEFVHTLDDILWRRSKMGLHISEMTRTKLSSALPNLLKATQEDESYYDSASGY